MPIETGVWRINDEIEKIKLTSIETEKKLEEILVKNLGIIDPELLFVGSQITTDYGKTIPHGSLNDLLACVGIWEFEPDELESIMQDIEQARLMELKESRLTREDY